MVKTKENCGSQCHKFISAESEREQTLYHKFSSQPYFHLPPENAKAPYTSKHGHFAGHGENLLVRVSFPDCLHLPARRSGKFTATLVPHVAGPTANPFSNLINTCMYYFASGDNKCINIELVKNIRLTMLEGRKADYHEALNMATEKLFFYIRDHRKDQNQKRYSS